MARGNRRKNKHNGGKPRATGRRHPTGGPTVSRAPGPGADEVSPPAADASYPTGNSLPVVQRAPLVLSAPYSLDKHERQDSLRINLSGTFGRQWQVQGSLSASRSFCWVGVVAALILVPAVMLVYFFTHGSGVLGAISSVGSAAMIFAGVGIRAKRKRPRQSTDEDAGHGEAQQPEDIG